MPGSSNVHSRVYGAMEVHSSPVADTDVSNVPPQRWSAISFRAVTVFATSCHRDPFPQRSSQLSTQRKLLPMEYFVVDVRPEFFECKCQSVQTDICGPALPCLCPGALCIGVERLEIPAECTSTDHLRIIGLRSFRIEAGSCSSTECVECPMQKGTSQAIGQ